MNTATSGTAQSTTAFANWKIVLDPAKRKIVEYIPLMKNVKMHKGIATRENINGGSIEKSSAPTLKEKAIKTDMKHNKESENNTTNFFLDLRKLRRYLHKLMIKFL